jgi:hypothetical protein
MFSPNLKERGSVMILLSLLLVTLFALIALTIDTTIITSSQSHLQASADAATLGALETYGNQLSIPAPNNVTPVAALAAANTRASSSLRQNFNYNPGKFLQRSSGNTQDAIGSNCNPTINPNGCLRPIIWYAPIPAGPDCPNPLPVAIADPLWRACPCNQSCECGENCLNDPLVTGLPGNGLKLIYRTAQNSPIKALFGSIVAAIKGQPSPEVGLTVTSTAILTPRNAVFLLDLSDSMVGLARPAVGVNANFYDQNPASLPPLPSNLSGVCFKRRYAYPIPVAGTCDPINIEPPYPASLFFTRPRASWNNCLTPTERLNYACFSTDGTAAAPPVPLQYTSGSRADNFLINTVVDPEPLTSALDSVNQAMNSFLARNVPNDRLGIIGFDDQQINNRILALNINTPTTIQPTPLNDPLFAQFELATRVTGAGRLPITNPARYSKYLFPRAYDQNMLTGQVASDLPTAFRNARSMIKNTPSYRQAQNFVVMFSDGMANCLSPLAPLPRCGSTDTFFTQSLGLLETELVEYSRDKIAAHFFLVGAKSQPHRLAWKNSAGGCATADEIEDMATISGQKVPVVNAQGTFLAEGTALVNQIYPWIKATGGLWAPILDSNGANSLGACPVINQATLNAQCAGISNLDKMNALITSGAVFDRGSVKGGAAVWGANLPYWDSYGRILCDPQNRTTAQQVNDAMKLILGKPPFSLVRPN